MIGSARPRRKRGEQPLRHRKTGPNSRRRKKASQTHGPPSRHIRRRTSLSFPPPRRSTVVGFRKPAGRSEVEALRRVRSAFKVEALPDAQRAIEDYTRQRNRSSAVVNLPPSSSCSGESSRGEPFPLVRCPAVGQDSRDGAVHANPDVANSSGSGVQARITVTVMAQTRFS